MAEKPEDLNLPASVVARIIKEALPEGVNVSKEAKSAIGRAASIFILYATTCANTYAIKGKRKTITPNDLFQAVEDMELQEFLPEMKECLETFKKEQKEKKEAAADRKRKQTGVENVPDSSNSQNEELSGTTDKMTTKTGTINVSTEDAITSSLHSQETEGNESQEEMETDILPQFSDSLATHGPIELS